MSKAITFAGKVVRSQFIANSEQYMRHHLSKFEGKEVTLVLKPKTRVRSLPQNATMWWWLEILSNHTGHTPDELNRLFKGLHLPKKFISYKGKEYALATSTSDLTTAEMAEYMERLAAEAAELGCALPEPDPLHSAR